MVPPSIRYWRPARLLGSPPSGVNSEPIQLSTQASEDNPAVLTVPHLEGRGQAIELAAFLTLEGSFFHSSF